MKYVVVIDVNDENFENKTDQKVLQTKMVCDYYEIETLCTVYACKDESTTNTLNGNILSSDERASPPTVKFSTILDRFPKYFLGSPL